jgi:hypothetical protein
MYIPIYIKKLKNYYVFLYIMSNEYLNININTFGGANFENGGAKHTQAPPPKLRLWDGGYSTSVAIRHFIRIFE